MKEGDVYICGKCTLELTVTKGCSCDGSEVCLTCCGEPMEKKESGKKGCCCC